jgi:hypothetical protein
MPTLGAAIGGLFTSIGTAIGGAFAAGGFFTTIVGRLLVAVVASALMRALQPKPKEPGIRTSVTQTGGSNPQSFIIGNYATGGSRICPPMSHGTVGGTPNAYLTEVIQVSDVPGQTLSRLIVNDEYVTLGPTPHPDYGLPATGRYAGYLWCKFYNGTQTTADPMLLSKYGSYPERPWSADMIGRGMCYAILTCRYDRGIWNSIPRFKFELGSIPLYDPRKDTTVGGSGSHRWANKATWAPTTNPFVQIYNIMRGVALDDGSIWGGRIDAADIPLSSFFAAMNECDLLVSNGAGTEAQFRTGYEVQVSDEPYDVIEELMKASSGQMAEVGGLWKARAGSVGAAVLAFTDADILITREQELTAFPGFDGSYNGVHVSYPEPVSLWEAKEAPPVYNATYEAQDLGQRLVADLSLPACPYGAQARRIGYAYIEEERRFRRHGHYLPPDAAILEPLDAVSWTSTVNGYAGKLFEVAEVTDDPMTCVQRVILRERDPADYSYPSLPAAPGTPAIFVPPAAVDVPGWAANGISLFDPGAIARRAAVEMVWTGTNLDGATGLEYEVRLAASGVVVARGVVTDVASGRNVVSSGIIGGVSYEARGRVIVPGAPGNWSAWDMALTPVIPGIAMVDGAMQSANFVAGSAGWAIDETGNAEFNNLVTRGWIQEGAVSDKLQTISPGPHSVPAASSTTVMGSAHSTGPNPRGQFIEVGVVFDGRTPPGSAAVTFSFQIRYAVFGAGFGAWNTLLTFAPGASWEMLTHSVTVSGALDDCEIRVIATKAASGSGGTACRDLYLTSVVITK